MDVHAELNPRWLALVPSVLLAFFFVGVCVGFVADMEHVWIEPAVGFCTAATVVAIAFMAAPSHKVLAAAVVFLFGSIVAWWLLRSSVYPEGYVHAYERTRIPLQITIASGLLTLAALATGYHAHDSQARSAFE